MIFLVGFMGCGKSTIGRYLAAQWGIQLIDLDQVIMEQAGCSIPEIFQREGETGFRQREHEALVTLCHSFHTDDHSPKQTLVDCVVALGGGAFVRENNRTLISQNGTSIWLETSFETCLERVKGSTDRPLFQNLEQAENLFQQRQPMYALADLHIKTDQRSIEEIASEICFTLGK